MPTDDRKQNLSLQSHCSGQELWQWRRQAQQQAIARSVPVAELDWLLRELTGLDRLALRLESFKSQALIPLSVSIAQLNHLWNQRTVDRVPVQYLTGTAHWREFTLKVSPAVLIPRPETEHLIDLARAATSLRARGGNWADLGTGSGAIALGLATTLPSATIHAVDCSQAALAIAQENTQTYQLSDRIQFYHGDWLNPLVHLRRQLSGIVSNPPYIPQATISALQPEVAGHEPHLALDGGPDGLASVRQLIAIAPEYLQTDGLWLVELMAGQAIAVAELLQQQGRYHRIQIHADLAGIDRFVLAYRA